MNRSRFLSTLLAAICAPFAASKAAAATITPLTPPTPTPAPAPLAPLARPVSLRMGVMGFVGDEQRVAQTVWAQSCPGGLASEIACEPRVPDMQSFAVCGRTAEELMAKAMANVAVVIASVEYPDQGPEWQARLVQLVNSHTPVRRN